jgi:hypothetical protein
MCLPPLRQLPMMQLQHDVSGQQQQHEDVRFGAFMMMPLVASKEK